MPIPRQKSCGLYPRNVFKQSVNYLEDEEFGNINFEQMDPLILPTPPRSPNSKSSSYYNGGSQGSSGSGGSSIGGSGGLIPDPILDDLFQLLEEDQNDEDEILSSRKRKISEMSLLGNTAAAEMSLDNALLELGFVHEHSESPDSDASYLIDHLLNSYHSNDTIDYESPPPTNPPSPMQHQNNYYEEDEELSPPLIKSEPQSSAASSVDYESDHDSYTEDLLKDFESFDTFEKLASSSSNKESVENFIGNMLNYENTSSDLEANYSDSEDSEEVVKAKRVKFDSESNDSELMKNDIMWNAPNMNLNMFGTFGDLLNMEGNFINSDLICAGEEEIESCEDSAEDIKLNSNNYELEYIKNACLNDHSYAAVKPVGKHSSGSGGQLLNGEEEDEDYYEEDRIKQEQVEIEIEDVKPNLHHLNSNQTLMSSSVISFDKIQKKTKILVPLKHLMETLQQKSYLVSPLGPGKKVIRLTGTGETVKGVFQSSILTMPQSSSSHNSSSSGNSSKPSGHNVRKRPHNPILNTRYTSPKLMEAVSSTTCDELLSSSSSQLPLVTKKKTKAHNNMERMRRIDLRNSFDNLKKLVPILAKSPKCSKVEILKKAEEYIRGLRTQEKKLIKEEQSWKIKLQQNKNRLEQN